MRYFSESSLREAGEGVSPEGLHNIRTAAGQARITVFLSHSHSDRPVVRGLIRYLDGLGISIYVDWNDSSMPRVTSRATAAMIKSRIRSCRLFMVLATRNALNSRWVPWEVGLADQMKGESAVSVIAVADPSGRFDGAEYMQLYQLVAFPNLGDAPRVFAAETRADGPSLVEYLQRGI
jgi:hypothetical protein